MNLRARPDIARKHLSEMLQLVAVPVGTGKSHVLIALGHALAADGMRVRYVAVADLFETSDLNYTSGETRPNLVVVKVGTGGKVSLFTAAGTHVVFDVAGWYAT